MPKGNINHSLNTSLWNSNVREELDATSIQGYLGDMQLL